jgi:hypothetical protein
LIATLFVSLVKTNPYASNVYLIIETQKMHASVKIHFLNPMVFVNNVILHAKRVKIPPFLIHALLAKIIPLFFIKKLALLNVQMTIFQTKIINVKK